MPASSYSLPPWIGQGADPAAHYAQGIQIGTRIGAEQAAQQFQYNQMLLQQQKQEFEQQLQQEKVNLAVSDAIRTHQAQNAYSQLIGQGLSPEQALMVAGPAMGESVNELLRTQAMRTSRAQQLQLSGLRGDIAMMNAQTMAGRAEEQRRQDAIRNAQTKAAADARQQSAEKALQIRQRQVAAQAMDKISKHPDMIAAQGRVRIAKSALDEIDTQHWFSKTNKENARTKAQENLDKETAALEKVQQRLYKQYQIENLTPEEMVPQAGDEGPGDATQATPVPAQISSPQSTQTNRVLRFVPGQGFQPVQ